MIFRSIVGRLWVMIVILAVISLSVLGLSLAQLFEQYYFNLHGQQLIREGKQLAQIMTSIKDPDEKAREILLVSKFIGSTIVVVDQRGMVEACTDTSALPPGMHAHSPEMMKVWSGGTSISSGKMPGSERPSLTAAVPIVQGGQVSGAVLLYAPQDAMEATVGQVRRLIILAAGATIVLATVLGFFLSRRVSKPLLGMQKVALAMADGNFGEKVPVNSGDEIGQLGTSLNTLSARLKQTLEDLSREKERLNNTLTSITDGVITLDLDGNIISLNQPARQYLSLWGAGQTGGVGVEHLPDLIRNSYNGVLAENEAQDGEVVDEDRVTGVRAVPLRDEGGTVTGVVVALQDITKEHRLEQMRRDFVANVSHELRTPLSFLQGYTEALIDGMARDEEQRQSYLNIIQDETLRLRRLVDEILDLSMLEGQLPMAREQVDLRGVILRVARNLKPEADRRGLTFVVNVDDKLPAVVGDEDRLAQVYVNLLDNAFRYAGDNGRVEVCAASAQGNVQTIVSDSGAGIPPSELPLIWERFYKVDKSRSRSQRGTGLGLAIVKNIVQAHHGIVEVDSTVGKGTRFTVSLPASVQNLYLEGTDS